MSWLVMLRPTREEMAFEPTDVERGAMTAEIRPLRIAVR
jgi:hypothetical protein